MRIDTAIEYLKGVGPAKADLLKKELNIFTCRQLLHHFPFRYVDRSTFQSVRDIQPEMAFVQLKGVLNNVRKTGMGRAARLNALFNDKTGSIELVWFQGATWMQSNLKPGREYVLFGKPKYFNGRYSLPHPELELLSDYLKNKSTGLYPVYPSTEKLKTRRLDSKGIEALMRKLVAEMKSDDFPEFMPLDILNKYRLPGRFETMKGIHFPTSQEAAESVRRRLKFEELFVHQLRLLRLKYRRRRDYRAAVFKKVDNHFLHFYENILPFELTGAQKRVLKEIRRDTFSGFQMNRLLQGDVGSGKTIVALMSMLMAIDNDFQACLMAPTEILAQQHLNTISGLLSTTDLNVRLLTGSTKKKERVELFEQLADGTINILIGTHALIEDPVIFKELGMVVIDEQHRFGVAQRSRLWKKGSRPPHMLVMTATPIPRTLSMTMHGDLDVSVIDELPPGRKEIATHWAGDEKRGSLFGFMKQQIALGRQVYVVYPLIDESETLSYKDLTDGYESICRAFPRPDYQVSIVHGRMPAADKEYEMQRFKKGETHILVSTTVIEVGVDVPNASVMVIESAERFGLSQLHQLRGRIGRGSAQSYCLLMTGAKLSAEAQERMRIMCKTNDGFVIAEEDLRLRGPGDIEGTRQSGLDSFRLADIVEDADILEECKLAATEIAENDLELNSPANLRLKQYLEHDENERSFWRRIG